MNPRFFVAPLFVTVVLQGCAGATPALDAGVDAGSDAGIEVDGGAFADAGSDAGIKVDGGAFADACAAVSGAVFESVELLEGGNCVPPDGGTCPKMHWRLKFSAPAKFSWVYTDVVQVGTYTCTGTTLIPTPGTAATYNSANDQLTWAGKAYERK